MKLSTGAQFLVSQASHNDVFIPEEFSDEQREMGNTIEQFIKNEVAPRSEAIEQQDFPTTLGLVRQLGELGMLMIDVPVAYGGLELDKATSMYAAEKLAPTGSFFVTCGVTSNLGSLPLVYYGTHEQKSRYLPKLATGELIGAYCLTEPDAGSDALGAKTTAVLTADKREYVLNGTKQFITNGGIADLFTVFAKVDKIHFTAFLVERDSPGLSIGTEEKKLGIRGSSTTQVVFENVRVPVDSVLGDIGKGHKIAFNILNLGRIKVAAGTVGTAKGAFAEGVAYSNLRKQFKAPISSFGAMKEKIAEMSAAIFASESLLYRVTGLMDARLATIAKETENYYLVYQQGIEEYALECSIAKVFCTEVLARVVDEVVQIHGGYGFTQEYSAERYYRDERINRIFEGTNEINRILIATLALRRIKAGDIDLPSELAKALEALSSCDAPQYTTSPAFQQERNLLANLKRTFFIIVDAARQKHQERISDEQETLMALAEIAINVFALESAVLRAEKGRNAWSEAKKGYADDAVQVLAFACAEKCAASIRKAANYLDCGGELSALIPELHRFAGYHLPGLLQAKRRLADAAIEQEKYMF